MQTHRMVDSVINSIKSMPIGDDIIIIDDILDVIRHFIGSSRSLPRWVDGRSQLSRGQRCDFPGSTGDLSPSFISGAFQVFPSRKEMIINKL